MKTFDFDVGARGQLSVVATDGKLFLRPQTCKDYIHDGVTRGVYRKYAKGASLHNPGCKGTLNKENPTFVYWTSIDTVQRNAEKFAQMMNQIESIMNLQPTVAYPVDTGIGDNAAPFVAEADSWWMKSPVAVNAYVLLLRLSVAMKLGESFDNFIDRMSEMKTHDAYSIRRDAGYLKEAREKGHIAGLLEKSLPCFNREGHSDYLLSYHERGFVKYKKKTDSAFPMDEDGLWVRAREKYEI